MKPYNAGYSVLLIQLGLTVAVMTGGLALAERAKDQHVIREAELQSLLAAQECADRGALFVSRGELAGLLPFSSAWEGAFARVVPVVPQMMTMPMLAEASIAEATIQALTDGEEIAWRISWSDSTADWNVETARFTDAVALQFPLSPKASFMMGAGGQLVQILHWKALWQKDVDEHFQDVQDLHPNYWADLYWFTEGPRPYRVPDSFQRPESRAWFAAHQAGNPMSDFERSQPVEELVAEGFGTLTHQENSVSAGSAEWRDGVWAVVVRRPLRTDDPFDYQFFAGTHGQVAVAIWDGSAGNVGGRKHHSDWIDFQLEVAL